ncbi:Structural maintenance of chromosomes protein 1 [Dimargaris xerosporica]|nr:Structural maintenance of chromosomes protein 1 [Dimargaris xerosporica]
MGRLVELEVENFKSYKGRQKIGPFKTFTSVIGPNGAGKSNLMDAISFVLGVKSAQLRSAQLRELIYSGRSRGGSGSDAENDSPEALPSRGHVAAIYVDDNGARIKFMRTITASGSSEYKINNKTVTYAQYNDRLEQQNILIKARNFLVFQGDVEAVASQSARDLTKLIEQISGSWEFRSEYDQLKAQQDIATENSQLNYSKKKDIASEIKEYQGQKAELDRFQQLTSKKNQVVVRHLLWKLFHIEQKTASLEKVLDDNFYKSEELQRRQAADEAALKEAKRDQARIYKQIMKIEKRLKQRELEVEQEKPFLIGLDEKLVHLQTKVARCEENVASVIRDETRQTSVADTLERELANVDRAAAKFEATWKAKMQAEGPVLDEHALSEYHRLKEQVTVETVQAQQQLEHLVRSQKIQSETTARLRERIEELKSRKANLQDNQRGLVDYIDKSRHQVQQMERDLAERTSDLKKFQTERHRIQQMEVECNEKLTSVLNRLAQARVDKRESEKEQRMRECLESLKRIFPGVYGRVSNLCRPSQRKFDTAVATALGRHLDAVVVDKQVTAIECIQHMKEQRAGQATFLPLDTISVKPVAEKYRSLGKGVRLAQDVVEYDTAVEKAVQFACGDTVVCDSMRVAKHVCYDQKHDVKAVTLDGTVIHRTGMITGGSQDANAAHGQQRWEEKELDNLTRAKDRLVTQLQDLAREKRRLHSDEHLQSQISGLETRLQFAREELSTAMRKREGVDRELEHVDHNLTQSQPRYQTLESEQTRVGRSVEELQSTIGQVEDRVFAQFCQRIGVAHIREYEERQLKFSRETTDLRLKFSSQQSKLRNQLLFEQQQLQQLQDRRQRLETLLQDHRNTLAQLQIDKQSREAKVAQVTQQISELQAEMDRVRATYDEQSAQVAHKKKAQAATQHGLDQLLRESAGHEALVQRHHVERGSILRRCKLEEIVLPLAQGSLADLSLDETDIFFEADDMDLDSSDSDLEGFDQSHPKPSAPRARDTHALRTPRQRELAKQRASQWSITVDFESLTARERTTDTDEMDTDFANQVQQLGQELDRLAPNMHVYERLDNVESRLRETERDFEMARREAKTARERFNAIKQQRYDAFYQAYSHISEKIDQIYKDLTKSRTFPLGGTAYLSLEDSEEPYLQGVKYHAMPPMKRFRDMEQLSGGEKTVAALALLFAIHSYQPSPFFVLDEVDAALDNTNVAKVATYIREHCGDNFQFIVISLKQSLYEKAQSLVGIYREQSINSSRTLTIDLEKYPE